MNALKFDYFNAFEYIMLVFLGHHMSVSSILSVGGTYFGRGLGVLPPQKFERSRCNFPHSGAFYHVFRFKMISRFHYFSLEPAWSAITDYYYDYYYYYVLV